jgi:hypothetical protein
MTQGLRRRVALLGAGLLVCTGLAGCMDSDSKPIKGPPPLSKAATAAANQQGGANQSLLGTATKTNQLPSANSTYGNGANANYVQPTGFNQSAGGVRTSPASFQNAGGNMAGGNSGFMNNSGTISGQQVPGVAGTGASMAPNGMNGVVPGIAPPSNPPQMSYDSPMPPYPPQR